MNVNEDLNYVFNLSRQCLRLIGVWPDPHISLNDFRRPSIRFIIATCIMCLYVVTPQILNVIRVWGNISLMIEILSAINFNIMAVFKIISTRYHGEKLRILIASIATDWTNSKNDWKRNAMLKLTKSGRNLSFGYFIVVMGTILPAYYVRLENVFQNIHQPRRYLVYRFDYIQKSPNYEITCFLQICGSTCAMLSNYCVDSFISIFVLHICAQLINLRITLNNLIDKVDKKSIAFSKFKEDLAAIIIRHGHLIRNAKTIDDCYNPALIVHLIGATLQLCLVTFQVFTIITDNVNVPFIKIIFLTFFTLLVLAQLYIYCYAAESLLTESTNMGYGVYECKWYNIPVNDAKNLMFIVYRSTIPLKLTAGKFATFSLELFGIAVKTSMGYLSALLTIRE
ncbi:odorant receptor 13a-like isoform X2 [Anoplolepis gracilipes]|uniref:odorant receptor 13a-like isoform X2 n=1 Tax=Anoplolepis gracilipes TaxID=354296 RepID=UPI003B9E9374